MNSPWNALIVDDEALARRNLELALAEHRAWRCVGSCASAAEARVALQQQSVDLLLLDIQMPRQNGLSLAAELVREPKPPLIVFVTAYDEHALAAFDVYALDYLLKPFDDARFAAMLQRADQWLCLQQASLYTQSLNGFLDDQSRRQTGQAPAALQHITVRSVGQIERIDIGDVDWIGAAGNYVELHLGTRCVLHRSTLAALEERLPPGEFLRVHRTTLVRRRLISALAVTGDSTYALTLKTGQTLPVSERCVKAVRELFD